MGSSAKKDRLLKYLGTPCQSDRALGVLQMPGWIYSYLIGRVAMHLESLD